MSKHTSEYLSMTRRSIFWLLAIAVAIGATYYFQGISYENTFYSLPVSLSTKEYPIHSVETEKKQVSLSFDAAWGDGKMRK